MVKKFRGKVKIADVQAEFDKLVNKINSLDARINKVNTDKENIDWRYGGNTLAPTNYTLTVGGLKQALNNFDGAVYGARAFKTDNTHFKMTDGLLISKYGGFRLPDSILAIPTSNRILYYNVFSGQYQWSPTGSGTVIIDNPFQAPTEILNINETRSTDSQDTPIPTGVYGNISDDNEAMKGLDGANINNDLLEFWNVAEQSQEDLSAGRVKLDIKDYFKIPLTIGDNSKTITFDYGERISYSVDQGNYPEVKAKGNLVFGILERDATTFTPLYKVGLYGYNYCGISTYIVDGLSQSDSIISSTLLSTETNAEHVVGDGSVINKTTRFTQYDNPSGFDCSVSYYEEVQDGTTYPTLEIRSILKSVGGHNIYDNKIKISNFYASDFNDLTSSQINSIVQRAKDLVPKINCVLVDNFADSVVDLVEVMQTDYVYDKQYIMNPSYYNPEFMTADGEFHYGEPEQVTDGVYKICEISPQRNSLYLNDFKNVQVEDIYGTYEVAVQDRKLYPFIPDIGDLPVIESLNNQTVPRFIAVFDSIAGDSDWNRYIRVYFNGKEIAYNGPFGYRQLNYWTPVNYLYLPKGASNPFSSNYPNLLGQRMYSVKVNKNIKG